MAIRKTSGMKKIVSEIKSLVASSKITLQKGINTHILMTYWNIGKIIATQEKKEKIDSLSSRQMILDLSRVLTKEIGKGFSRSNLFNMRSFFLNYPSVQTLSGQLGWSHYCELLLIDDKAKRSFYEKECENSSWSVRELKRQIESSLFERLILSKSNGQEKIGILNFLYCKIVNEFQVT